MLRLHEDDLVGHVLGQEAWEVVSFPAVAEAGQPIRSQSRPGRRRTILPPA
jgi:hypothetical protein